MVNSCALSRQISIDTTKLQLDFPLGTVVRIVDVTSRWYRKEAHVCGIFSNEAAQGCLVPQGLVLTFDWGKHIYNYSEEYVRDRSRMRLVRKGSGRTWKALLAKEHAILHSNGDA